MVDSGRSWHFRLTPGIDIDMKNDRLLAAQSFAVQGDLTVLVNWQSKQPN